MKNSNDTIGNRTRDIPASIPDSIMIALLIGKTAIEVGAVLCKV
jgi:hypothetical protein